MFALNEHVAPKLLLFFKKELTCSYFQISLSPDNKIPVQRVVNNEFRAKILLLKLTQGFFCS